MSESPGNNTPLQAPSDGLQRARPLHGNTSGLIALSPRLPWTLEEDETLRKAVQHFEGKDWEKIAERCKGRTVLQCWDRWNKLRTLDLANVSFSKEEDELLIELVKKFGEESWCTIAALLPGRTDRQCQDRWHNDVKPDINEEAWTQNRELALVGALQIDGNKSAPGSWTSGIIPFAPRRPWTAEEDETLRKAVQHFEGKDWEKIAERCKDRTVRQCWHRWNKLRTLDLANVSFSKEEDELLIELVKKFGEESWCTIAALLPGRTDTQCQDRWDNHLNPNINKEAGTPDVNKLMMPGRTDDTIKNHRDSFGKRKSDVDVAPSASKKAKVI